MTSPDPTITRLRIGILLESPEIPAWQFSALQSIHDSDCAEITVMVVADPAESKPESAGGLSCCEAVYRAFKRLEDRKRPVGGDACALIPAGNLPTNIERIDCARTRSGELDPTLMESIRARELDVLVALVEPIPMTGKIPLARLGVWRFESDGRAFRPADGSRTGFPELVRRSPCLSSSLQIFQPGGGVVRTAYETCSAIDYVSHVVTRSEHLWKCSTFLLRALKKCHEIGGERYLHSLPIVSQPRNESVRSGSSAWCSFTLPFAFLSYFLWRIRRKIQYRIYQERWILLFGTGRGKAKVQEFTALAPPEDRFWADPHVIEKDGLHHVFFEDASQQTGLGHISLMSETANGAFAPPKAILRRPYHLSYPFVFEWQGAYFLVPESAENRTVELYRCVRFPDEWTFEHNLMEGISAYDATVVEHQGSWWLFANIRACDGASSWDELHIFTSGSPISRNWRPHRGNPVISDVRRARPAGRFFAEGGKLYRPSQDSSLRYGHALRINEVVELNEHAYKEVPIETIEPDWHRSIRAVHTYSRAGKLTFVDAIRREPRRRHVRAGQVGEMD